MNANERITQVFRRGAAERKQAEANRGKDAERILRKALAAAQPIPAPLGQPLTEHVDVWPEWVVEARTLLGE